MSAKIIHFSRLVVFGVGSNAINVKRGIYKLRAGNRADAVNPSQSFIVRLTCQSTDVSSALVLASGWPLGVFPEIFPMEGEVLLTSSVDSVWASLEKVGEL